MRRASHKEREREREKSASALHSFSESSDKFLQRRWQARLAVALYLNACGNKSRVSASATRRVYSAIFPVTRGSGRHQGLFQISLYRRINRIVCIFRRPAPIPNAVAYYFGLSLSWQPGKIQFSTARPSEYLFSSLFSSSLLSTPRVNVRGGREPIRSVLGPRRPPPPRFDFN